MCPSSCISFQLFLLIAAAWFGSTLTVAACLATLPSVSFPSHLAYGPSTTKTHCNHVNSLSKTFLGLKCVHKEIQTV